MAQNAKYISLSLLILLVSVNGVVASELDVVFTTLRESIERLKSIDMEYVER